VGEGGKGTIKRMPASAARTVKRREKLENGVVAIINSLEEKVLVRDRDSQEIGSNSGKR